jgi:hypothetical protein
MLVASSKVLPDPSGGALLRRRQLERVLDASRFDRGLGSDRRDAHGPGSASAQLVETSWVGDTRSGSRSCWRRVGSNPAAILTGGGAVTEATRLPFRRRPLVTQVSQLDYGGQADLGDRLPGVPRYLYLQLPF